MLDGNDKISNLSQLVAADLDYLEEKFKAAKLAMDQATVQIKKARRKFEDLVIEQLEQQLGATRRGKGGSGEVTQTDDILPILEELKSKISILKSKIPFNLINPSKFEQLMNNSRFLWIPRNAPPQRRVIGVPPPPSPPPSIHPLTTYRDVQRLTWPEEVPYSCLALFLENTLYKKSLLLRLLETRTPDLSKAHDLLEKCVTSGIINPVYKKCSLIIHSYTSHNLIWSALREKYVATGLINPEDYTYLAKSKSRDDEDIIHSDPIQFPNPNCLEVLHLGVWVKFSTCHVEVPDPDIFFKNISTLDQLRYLSLRRVSMIKELPKGITKLKSLRTLDLNACHDLEVIPPEIANLRGTLTHLDMSECYFLEQMPIALSLLHELRVLKRFFIGEANKDKTCSLQNLVPLSKLEKLSIYTNVEGFPNESDLNTLQEFKELRNLTISWGGCSVGGCSVSRIAADTHQEGLLIEKVPAEGDEKFDFKLEKLDLQCVPSTIMYSWLRPDNLQTLKRLYIRGGQLHNLGQNQQDKWSVEMLRLKHLKKLTMDWDELKCLFPRMIFLEKVDCSNLTTFPTDYNGVWMDMTETPPNS